ncbi:hypothetical protein JW964_04970 [candidate division KSB1 bacterium]|nr:hypothetical protein [candidate division KSB1 bacterium]
MSQELVKIIQPLVDSGLFENAETAVRDLLIDYVLHQVKCYRTIIEKFEQKYSMNYSQFNQYLAHRAKNLPQKSSASKNFMLEEEDALDWKIATEMLQSWLGIQERHSA